MKHSVRSTLVALGLGVLVQRLLQLAAFWCIAQRLGLDNLGVYAQGMALAAVLAVLAGTGVRNVVARAVAREPAAAGDLVRAAVQARLVVGIWLGALAILAAVAWAAEPWFWILCVLQVVPAAFDLKNLLDATGRTRAEVALESSVALLQFLLVLCWSAGGGDDLTTLAAIALGSRCLYLVGAVRALARLPRRPASATAVGWRGTFAVGAGQTAHELLATGDVWLVALWFGDAATGLYAVAARLAAAALLPSMQLARLLLPHLLRAGADGDAGRTIGTALRATLLATLPMVAGGIVVAEPLCALFGPPFAAAAPVLGLVLLAGTLQHLGWQCSHALFAAGRDGDYSRGLWRPALLHTALLCCAGGLLSANVTSAAPQLAAALAATALLTAQATYALSGLHGLRRQAGATICVRAWGPCATALATAASAALPAFASVAPPLLLPLQLVLGGLGFLGALWFVELRGRLRQVGDGLAAASGFRT